jgi:hypothetical protein
MTLVAKFIDRLKTSPPGPLSTHGEEGAILRLSPLSACGEGI